MVYNYSQIVFKLFYQGVGTLNISVLGCGRWGSFIAWYLNKIGHNVILWGREGSLRLNEIKNTRKNSFLNFDKKIMVSSDIEITLKHAEVIVISINAQSLRNFCEILRNQFKKSLIGKTFVLCMKGIEESSGKRLSEILKETFDFDIKRSYDYDNFFKDINYLDLTDKKDIILEIKYDRFLEPYITDIINNVIVRGQSVSKYIMGRNV